MRAREQVNIGITELMVSGGNTKNGLFKSKVDPCGVCSLRVNANYVLCVQCGKWCYSRCAGVKNVNPMFSRDFACMKCEGNIGEAVVQEEMLCDEVKAARKFTYLGDRVSAGGGREVAA